MKKQVFMTQFRDRGRISTLKLIRRTYAEDILSRSLVAVPGIASLCFGALLSSRGMYNLADRVSQVIELNGLFFMGIGAALAATGTVDYSWKNVLKTEYEILRLTLRRNE